MTQLEIFVNKGIRFEEVAYGKNGFRLVTVRMVNGFDKEGFKFIMTELKSTSELGDATLVSKNTVMKYSKGDMLYDTTSVYVDDENLYIIYSSSIVGFYGIYSCSLKQINQVEGF